MKKMLLVFLYIVGVLLIIVAGLAVILWVKSPGKADPIADLNGNVIAGSISTIEKITLGGQEQYLIIRAKDITKPVMLFLHGGPGSPEIAFMKNSNQAIEKDFVMVYWEQLGAGKSWSKNILPESMNIGKFISDTRELSIYLANRFKQEKIYILGHSWGTLLGVLTAHKYPALFHAYFGVGQVAFQYKAEQISFKWVKEQANKYNDRDAQKALSKISFPDSSANDKTWVDYLMVERKYVTHFGGGLTHKTTGMWPVIKTLINTNEYTFNEKINYLSASLQSLKLLWPEVVNKNLFREIDSLQIPVYIFQGKYDYQTPYSVALEFYTQLKAPHKEFFTFENSAHSPLLEEVDKFNSIVRERK